MNKQPKYKYYLEADPRIVKHILGNFLNQFRFFLGGLRTYPNVNDARLGLVFRFERHKQYITVITNNLK